MYKKPVKRLKINFLGCQSDDNQVCSRLFAVVRRGVSLFHVVSVLKNRKKKLYFSGYWQCGYVFVSTCQYL